MEKKTRLEEEFEITGDKTTPIPDILFCCGKYLSDIEIRLWQILRKRVRDKSRNGYHKVPVMKTSISLISKLMGRSVLTVKRVLKKLENRGFVIVKRECGKENVYWLMDIKKIIEKERRMRNGNFIRSVKFTAKEAEENWQNQYLSKFKNGNIKSK